MRQLQQDHGTAIIMITHDLGVVAEIADDVVVMYAGRVIEEAPVDELFESPRHPYTWGLLGSLPRMDLETESLVQIPGQPPSLLNPPAGCRFNPRCSYTMDRCRVEIPPLTPAAQSSEHSDACFLDEVTKARERERLLVSMGVSTG